MFDEYSDLFSSKVRLRIIAALISGPKDFTTLKKLTETTDGNLGKQMEILLEAELCMPKRIHRTKSKTVYSYKRRHILLKNMFDCWRRYWEGRDKE